MLRRVSGSVARVQADLAGTDAVAVAKQLASGLAAEGMLPIRSAFGRNEKRCAGLPRQFAAAGNEVGVNVCLGSGNDAQPFGLRRLQVAPDFAVRVNHHGFAAVRAAEQEAGLREPFLVKPLQNHETESPSRLACRHSFWRCYPVLPQPQPGKVFAGDT